MLPIISQSNEECSIKYVLNKFYNIKPDDLLSYDLYLYNRDKATIGGLNDEFIMSPKLDNLESTYCALNGFIDSEGNEGISLFTIFNNEETGSSANNAADSTFLIDTLSRINSSLNKSDEELKIALAKSFILSIDNAHAVHPNHPELSDPNNLVYMNKGIVIKYNASMAYTSDAFSSSLVKSICLDNEIPTQNFYNKADVRGGSTLGAISLSHVSCMSCDIGLAQLAMHSNFEVAGTKDIEYMYKFTKSYYSSSFKLSSGKIEL